jgi:preprotein translocase subunit YajC
MNSIVLLQVGEGSGMQTLIMFAAFAGIMYFFMLRPQIKRNKEEKAYREGLKVGDSVVLTTGIHGEIDQMNDDNVILKIESGAKMRVERAALTKSYNPLQK